MPNETAFVEKLVTENLGLVKSIVNWMLRRRRPGRGHRNQLREEFYSAGLVGLWNAARRFTVNGGAGFKTYASKHIVGAIYDREYTTPGHSKKSVALLKEESAFVDTFSAENGFAPGPMEYPPGLLERKQRFVRPAQTPLLFSELQVPGRPRIDNTLLPCHPLPATLDTQDWVGHALRTLERRDRYILWRYAVDGWTLRAIGEVVNLVETGVWWRICKVIRPSLRRRLWQYKDLYYKEKS